MLPPYQITNYTRKRARKLHLLVKESRYPTKKIDVFLEKAPHQRVASVGARGYLDYPTFVKEKGRRFALTRRKLYKERHQKDRLKKGSRGWYADQLLW